MPPDDDIRAVCLRREGNDVVAMLHPAAAERSRETAVLLCPPFGWQEVCSYRGLRTWARTLADHGYATARLTLPACGDSAGDPHDPGLLEDWTDAVADAAAWLRAVAPARRVVAAGIGLGGMLACRALLAGAAVDDLVLWGVPGRGRALVREHRSHDRIISAAFPEDAHAAEAGDDDLELIGYVMSRETAAALESVDLVAQQGPPPVAGEGRRALMLGRDGLPPDAKLVDGLGARGFDVEVADGQDYGDLMANPQQSRAPGRTISLMLDWLGQAPEAAPGAAAALPGSDALRCRHGSTELTETPIWFDGVHGRIYGVLTEPVSPSGVPVCAVLLGAGALPHTGPNRSWVESARRWAARGVSTVRVDLGGIGESDGDDPVLMEEASVYDPWRNAEVGGILDELQRRGIADRFVLGGLCSGAYRAVRQALVDPRVQGLLLINLWAFLWSPELVSERGRRDALADGLPNARGRSIDRAFLRQALQYVRPDRAWRLLRRSAERGQHQEAMRALDVLRGQGTETALLLGQNEPLLAQFERQGLIQNLSRWPNVTVTRLPSRDHMYRAGWLRREVYDALDAAIDRTRDSTFAVDQPLLPPYASQRGN